MKTLDACKMAYRKHHLNDDTIGWYELGEILWNAICNEMVDDKALQWSRALKEPEGQKDQDKYNAILNITNVSPKDGIKFLNTSLKNDMKFSDAIVAISIKIPKDIK